MEKNRIEIALEFKTNEELVLLFNKISKKVEELELEGNETVFFSRNKYIRFPKKIEGKMVSESNQETLIVQSKMNEL